MELAGGHTTMAVLGENNTVSPDCAFEKPSQGRWFHVMSSNSLELSVTSSIHVDRADLSNED